MRTRAFIAHKAPTPEPDDDPIPEEELPPEEDPAPHPDPVAAVPAYCEVNSLFSLRALVDKDSHLYQTG